MNQVLTTHPTRSTLRRALISVATVIVFGFVGFILLFVGVVETTGCFLSCSEPNLLVGLPALAGAATSGSVGITSIVWAATGRPARTLGGPFAIVAAVLFVVALALASA